MKLQNLSQIVDFTPTQAVTFKGQTAYAQVAEAAVVITRPAKPKKMIKGKRCPTLAGEPLEQRLIISQVYSDDGVLLAEWFLLTNVEDNVMAATLAQWYYWRWQIESFYKLLKSAGHQLESWQQTTDLSIAKRLLVASMACVCVCQLDHQKTPEAESLKAFLVKLSGRQMKRTKPITHSAMLDGLWIFLSMQDMMSTYPTEQLQTWADMIRPRE